MSTKSKRLSLATTLESLIDAYHENPEGCEKSNWDEISRYDGEVYFVNEQSIYSMLWDCQEDPELMANVVRILIDKLAEEQGQ